MTTFVWCVAGATFLLGAWGTWWTSRTRQHALRDLRDRRLSRHASDVLRRHEARVYLEQQLLPERPRPSGRTITDDDDVVHMVPAGCFAITMCGLEIPIAYPDAVDLIDRYTYDPADVVLTTCVACLGCET